MCGVSLLASPVCGSFCVAGSAGLVGGASTHVGASGSAIFLNSGVTTPTPPRHSQPPACETSDRIVLPSLPAPRPHGVTRHGTQVVEIPFWDIDSVNFTSNSMFNTSMCVLEVFFSDNHRRCHAFAC